MEMIFIYKHLFRLYRCVISMISSLMVYLAVFSIGVDSLNIYLLVVLVESMSTKTR